MQAYLVGATSFMFLRIARYSKIPRVDQCDACMVQVPEERPHAQWWRELVEEVDNYLKVDVNNPIELAIPSASDRVRTRCIDCSVVSRSLPKGAFLRLELETGTSIQIQSPEYSFVWLAHMLDLAVKDGQVSRAAARAIVVQYGCELCGTYAPDANPTYIPGTNPDADSTHYFLEPATSAAKLCQWCQDAKGVPGVVFARSCAKRVVDLSGSPMETRHAVILSFPCALGGVDLGEPLMNQEPTVGKSKKSVFHQWPFRPDLQWPAYDLYVEHLGGKHGMSEQYLEDSMREQDYASFGALMFTTTLQDFETANDYDNFLRRLAAGLSTRLTEDADRAAKRIRMAIDDRELRSTRWNVFDALADSRDWWATGRELAHMGREERRARRAAR